ncbi:MAG: hypothetical protein PHR63_05010 [Methanoregulaceae archaeon]|nr:hypothetical protein [Methanoregulaceae archaeon]
MKKFVYIFVIFTLLSGIALADPGIPAVPETQGIDISTTVYAIGNFASSSDMQWMITNDDKGLSDIPPLDVIFATAYQSTYSEDTSSNGNGLIYYDKELDVETSDQLSGQFNIEATKEIAFVGIDGARITSADNIFVDGAATRYLTDQVILCPFATYDTTVIPSYCNSAEAGSLIDMSVANVRTTSTDRFVVPSGDSPVELNHDILVTGFATDMPSQGIASTDMDVLILEGSGYFKTFDMERIILLYPDVAMERIEFSEATDVNGDISNFEKLMHYESSIRR